MIKICNPYKILRLTSKLIVRRR